MLNNYVDKIYVINLPHRTDRLEKVNLLSEKFNFQFQLFPAFNGKEKIGDEFTYEGIKMTSHYLGINYFKGQVGCLISHLQVIQDAKNNGYEKILVFEDDVDFCEDFNAKFETLMNKVNKDWDFLYLSGSVPNFIENFDGYSSVSSILTTHSYLMKSNIFDIVISNFKNNLFSKEVDVCYSKIHSSVKTYVSMPFITYQSDGYSDIGEGIRSYESIKKYL